MKKIAVLLNGAIKNDQRVIKTITTLSRVADVDLFYIQGEASDKTNFNKNVGLFSIKKENGLKTKLIQHSYFYNEFLFFVEEVLKQKKQYNYIWANDLPCLKPALKIKKKLNCKLIYDSHEIYTETLNQFFPQKTSLFKSLIFKIILNFMRRKGASFEKKAVKKVDKFITVGEQLKLYFERKYRVSGIEVVMNCPEKSEKISSINLKEQLGIEKNSKLFIYQGVLNYGRGLHLMINAFKRVNSDIYLLILGSGMIKEELKELVKDLNLEKKVFFHDKVLPSKLKSFTQGADFGINLLEDLNLSKKLAVPNKLFEYIHAGIPVISSNMPESQTVYAKFNIGKLVNNDEQEIANAINSMTKENVSEYKNNCQRAALEYNWENQQKVILDIIS